MAGSLSGFNAREVRAAFRLAMRVGSPNNSDHQVTFRWKGAKTYASSDPAGKPYDYTASPVTNETHPDVKVPAAVEYLQPASTELTAGEMDRLPAKLTLVDEDYEKVKGADVVVIGGMEFPIAFIEPPQGLVNVDIYNLHLGSPDLTRPT